MGASCSKHSAKAVVVGTKDGGEHNTQVALVESQYAIKSEGLRKADGEKGTHIYVEVEFHDWRKSLFTKKNLRLTILEYCGISFACFWNICLNSTTLNQYESMF